MRNTRSQGMNMNWSRQKKADYN